MRHDVPRIPHVRRRLPSVLAPVLAVLLAVAAAPAAEAAAVRAEPPAPGAVTALVVPVSGMTCALCTRGVEESIKLLATVDSASAGLSSGLVRVVAASGQSLNIREVKDRVQRAGFKVGGECEVEATGRFGFGPDRRITFYVPGRAYAFQVLEGAELKRLFRLSPGLKGDFNLTFRLHEHPRWKPPAISIVRGEWRSTAGLALAR